jgi:nucleoside-diphosphate-sugar epimerase
MGLRVALTGATGFVGREVLPLLLAAGHGVTALARQPSKLSHHGEINTVVGDLQNKAALADLTRGADVVVHLAGVVSAHNRASYFAANAAGTQAVCAAARASGVKRFVHVSSLAARMPELNAYAASKHTGEVTALAHADGMSVAVLRPAAVYGPGDRATLPLLKSLMAHTALLPGTSTQRFSMVHVADVAQALLAAVTAEQHGTFDVDDGAGGYGWSDLVDICQRHFGLPQRVMFLPRGVAMAAGCFGDGLALLRGKSSLINTGQLRQIYHEDWRVTGTRWPSSSPMVLEDGLPATIRWYQAQGLLPQRAGADRSANTHGKD